MTQASDGILVEHKYRRCEFDWVAVDLEGRVAFFATAGSGPVPERVIGMSDLFEEIEEEVGKLKPYTSALVVTNLKHDLSDWVRLAERGIYAFDWRNEIGSYELIAKPEDDTLEAACRDSAVLKLAERTTLPVRFSKTRSLRVSQGCWVTECLH